MLLLFLAPFISSKSKARRKSIVKSRSILSMLPSMPKKENTEEHREIKPLKTHYPNISTQKFYINLSATLATVFTSARLNAIY